MWQEKNNQLYREFDFKDFKQAFAFMTAVAKIAEAQNHHPKWMNEWNKVEIWLSTHEASNSVTDKDRELAIAIDKVAQLIENSNFDEKATTKVKYVKIYADGGSRGNPGPSASGYVLFDLQDKVLVERGVYLGTTTNNQAEYQALKFALEEAQKLGAQEVDVYLDSQLVVNQMLGTYKVKNPELTPIYEAIKKLVTKFEQVSFTHVPRALNKLADAMVNKALDEHLASQGKA